MGGKTQGYGSVSPCWLKMTGATRQHFIENICNGSKRNSFIKSKCHHVTTYNFFFLHDQPSASFKSYSFQSLKLLPPNFTSGMDSFSQLFVIHVRETKQVPILSVWNTETHSIKSKKLLYRNFACIGRTLVNSTALDLLCSFCSLPIFKGAIFHNWLLWYEFNVFFKNLAMTGCPMVSSRAGFCACAHGV